jgi:hypothetical protein
MLGEPCTQILNPVAAAYDKTLHKTSGADCLLANYHRVINLSVQTAHK